MRKTFIAITALLSLAGCERQETAAERQTHATRAITDEADRKIGMPALSQFSEKALLRDVYERRDKAGPGYAYLQGLDGRVTCLGKSMGYGIPYAAQFTAPTAPNYYEGGAGYQMVDQPEPNGLYMPSTANATWIQIVDPSTGKLEVLYVEPNLIVSPFRLKGAVVANDCADTKVTAP